MRKYAKIWKHLKSHKICTIRCRATETSTFIQAVKKEKARENAPRRALELADFGRLIIKVSSARTDGKAEITFKLIPLGLANNL